MSDRDTMQQSHSAACHQGDERHRVLLLASMDLLGLIMLEAILEESHHLLVCRWTAMLQVAACSGGHQ